MFPSDPYQRLVTRKFASFLFVIFLLTLRIEAVQSPEFRAVWVDAWGTGFLNSSQVTKLVSDCHTYNFNAVIVQMRRRGDAFYFPQAPNGEPRTTALASNYDALQEIINQCHSTNLGPRIEVHTWVTTHAIWGDVNNPPPQAGHVVNLHPEYLMLNSSGSKVMAEGYYLDPGNPDATLWNYNMAKDIVSRYDVDGFHWDYIRYPQQDSGYNPVAIARYNAEFGLTGQPSPSSAQFSDWRRRQVTDFLRWCNADLFEVKSNLVVSCSVFSSRSDAYSNRFQDWAAWTSEGIIDVANPMDYSANNSGVFNPRADDAYTHQGVRRIYVGPGAYLNTKENTVTQLNYLKNKGFQGSVLFSYRTPNGPQPTYPIDQTGTFTYIRDNYQPTWVNTPTLPWKTSPTKAILKGTVRRSDDFTGLYNVSVTITGGTTRTNLSEPHGKYVFFETAPGTYTVSATPPGLGTISTNVTIAAGQIFTVDLIIPVNDDTPPTISNVGATNITDNSAEITWTTDEKADSIVDYGLTVDYDKSASNGLFTVNHRVSLTGLDPDTIYNYEVVSADATGNEEFSTNFTFRTNPRGVVTDLIIDNPQATSVGSWSTGTSSTDKFGSDYRFKSRGTGAASFTFAPTLLNPGNYEIYEWHPQGGNRTKDAPHEITFNGGIQTISVNQQTNGGKWNSLGFFDFAAGTNGYVRITDAALTPTNVMADAIKFVYRPYPPEAPTNLQATTFSDTQIDLTWSDNSSNEFNFIILRGPSAVGPFTELVALPPDTTTYSDLNLTESTRYYYVVQATNTGGASRFSNQANTTTFAGFPIITQQPLSLLVPEGENATFTVGVRAHNPIYQWFFNDVPVSGGNQSSLTISNTLAVNEGRYEVVIRNASGAITSDFAQLRLTYFIHTTSSVGGTVQLNPNQTSFSFNDYVTLTAVPDPGGVFIGWTGDLSGTNPIVNVIMDHSITATAHFMPNSDLVVDNLDASFPSGSWDLQFGTTNKYASTFNSVFGSDGFPTAEAIFRPTIPYSGLYNIFVWYPSAGTATTNAPVFISYNGGSENVTVNQATNGGSWRLISSRKPFAQGAAGFVSLLNETGQTNKLVLADAFRFVLVNQPAIIIQPQSQTVNLGNTATFNVLASGTALAYQWQFNNTNILGATNTAYTASNVQPTNAGNYKVVLSNETGSLSSDNAALTVITTPPSLGSPSRFSDGRFQFSLTGSTGNYLFEASTNLINWVVLGTVTNSSGTIQFIDASSTNLPTRFYRTSRLP